MTDLTVVLLGFGVALAIAAVATPVARRVAVGSGLMDLPADARSDKIHTAPMPYLGGLAVLTGVAAGAVASSAWRELAGVAAGTVLLSVVGVADDFRPRPIGVRLLVQIAVAAIAVGAGVRATAFNEPFLDSLITVVWLLGTVNALNWIDHRNGLLVVCSLPPVFACLALSVLAGQRLVGALSAAVAGALVGFLPYNFPRARIFMGDGGAMPLGFLLGVLALKVDIPVGPPWSFGVPVCILALPLLDVIWRVTQRLRAGTPVLVGTADSVSHNLVRRGSSERRVVAILGTLSAVFASTGVLAGRGALPGWTVAPLLVVVALGGISLFPRAERVSGSSRVMRWERGSHDRTG